ncbi:LacI family transcriptional regulator [Paremcibacter congregatus]|uniref:LacI family transcriptional regulator n=2 Tax=Paremcibacter congregatus TaxID=2043170 RepID=A0A2G4YS45_9PROT|nr:LacI family transcriptional regulator [Paremcibacter congregatus]
MARKKETLKSIAANLGITHTSVSNAFINPSKVSVKLRKKILDYAKSVNYHGPNPAARSLRTGLCGAIGIIYNDQLSYAFSDPHDIAFLRGVSTVCEERGTNIVLIPLKNSDLDNFESLDAMVDGYILNAPYKSNPTTQRALSRGLPTVVVDFESPQHISVLTNDASVMQEMTSHITSLGHRKIGIITFPLKEGSQALFSLEREPETENYVVNQRLQGCRAALLNEDIELSNILVQEITNSRKGGAEAAQILMNAVPDITALICFSDQLAYGAMEECRRRKIDLPGRISITGFDGITPYDLSPELPALTTVRQDADQKGRKAAEALLNKASVKSNQIDIQAEVIIKDSTAKVWNL